MKLAWERMLEIHVYTLDPGSLCLHGASVSPSTRASVVGISFCLPFSRLMYELPALLPTGSALQLSKEQLLGASI